MKKDINKSIILQKLKEIKPFYERDGLILLGIFGSFARDEATKNSDIDILYDIEPKRFLSLYPGFKAFSRLADVKSELKKIFHRDIDMATVDNNSKVFQQFTLKDIVYV